MSILHDIGKQLKGVSMREGNWNIAMTFRLTKQLTEQQLDEPHHSKRGYKPFSLFVKEFLAAHGRMNVAFIGKYGLGGELGAPHIHLAVVVRGGKAVDIDYWERRWIELHGNNIS
jgi:hypothetical protein